MSEHDPELEGLLRKALKREVMDGLRPDQLAQLNSLTQKPTSKTKYWFFAGVPGFLVAAAALFLVFKTNPEVVKSPSERAPSADTWETTSSMDVEGAQSAEFAKKKSSTVAQDAAAPAARAAAPAPVAPVPAAPVAPTMKAEAEAKSTNALSGALAPHASREKRAVDAKNVVIKRPRGIFVEAGSIKIDRNAELPKVRARLEGQSTTLVGCLPPLKAAQSIGTEAGRVTMRWLYDKQHRLVSVGPVFNTVRDKKIGSCVIGQARDWHFDENTGRFLEVTFVVVN